MSKMPFPIIFCHNCIMKRMSLLLKRPLIIHSKTKNSTDSDCKNLSGEKQDASDHHASQLHQSEVEDRLAQIGGETLSSSDNDDIESGLH
mmetsp:Transcript_20510/g.56925  ORF Transcript_20510/g.56925 Transcript_20510/m.56925 type:complete len:90 (+) Transcript_20510:1591-1860(+)